MCWRARWCSSPTPARRCCTPATRRASPPTTPTATACKTAPISEAAILEIGSRVAQSVGHYSDIDMVAPAGGKPAIYTHRDGAPYQDIKRRGPED